MGEHFIKNIDIIKFKCFENFSTSGFKRVNLISGKNNVGKTAFMEAIYLNSSVDDVDTFSTALFSIKYMRENINLLTSIDNSYIKFIETTKKYEVISNIKKNIFEVLSHQGEKKYLFSINDENFLIESNKFIYTPKKQNHINFIDNFGFSNDNIIEVYASVQKNDKEQYLNNIINRFDSRIESFKVIDSKPQCKVNGDYIEITEFGDGLRHLISIVCSVFASENGYLFIDEIDNGIHYTQLDEIWKIIFEVSKELSCQVFATTHSKEMIESFTRTAIKLEDKEVSYIEFGLKDSEIKTLVYDYDMLVDEIEQNHEIRGW